MRLQSGSLRQAQQRRVLLVTHGNSVQKYNEFSKILIKNNVTVSAQIHEIAPSSSTLKIEPTIYLGTQKTFHITESFPDPGTDMLCYEAGQRCLSQILDKNRGFVF